jgi:A/G-specific adenine glycosylase
VGAYTAAAIASIVFSNQAAAVDGNVIRVVSRLRALAGGVPPHGQQQAMGCDALMCHCRPPQAFERHQRHVIGVSSLGH